MHPQERTGNTLLESEEKEERERANPHKEYITKLKEKKDIGTVTSI